MKKEDLSQHYLFEDMNLQVKRKLAKLYNKELQDYVERVVARQWRKTKGIIPIDDLRSVPNACEAKQLLRYDPKNKASLKTWLSLKVHYALLDYFRAIDSNSKETRQAYKKGEIGIEGLNTLHSLTDYSSVDESGVEELNLESGDDVYANLEKKEKIELVQEALSLLDDEERNIAELLLIHELTLHQVASRNMISVRKVHEIGQRAKHKLKIYLVNEGYKRGLIDNKETYENKDGIDL